MPLVNAFKQSLEETEAGTSSMMIMQEKAKAERHQQGIDVNKLEVVQWFDFTGCPKKYTD